MKRWEEQQRKKLYNNRIQQAKPTLVTQPKKPKGQTPSHQTGAMNRGMSAGAYEDMMLSQQQYTSGTEGNLLLLTSPDSYNPYGQQQTYQTPMSAGSPSHPISFSLEQSSSSSTASQSQKRQDQPIFQLLRAFKLQQYASKLSEIGYGQDVYKLALLRDDQRHDLIDSLKVLPGHKAKLMSLFDVIDEIYPRKLVVEQLKQFTPNTHNSGLKLKGQYANKQRVFSAAGQRQGVLTRGNTVGGPRGVTSGAPRSLIHQYEALDHQTKQAFNNTFLINLESVKLQIPQLFTQHFQQEDRRAAINHIFPPSSYYQPTLGPPNDPWSQASSGYDQDEIQQLVTKYAGRSHVPQNSSQNRQGSSSQNRQQQDESDRHLKQEMAQAMKVIDRVNKEFEQLTKSSQQEYDQIRNQQAQRHSTGSNHNARPNTTTNHSGATYSNSSYSMKMESQGSLQQSKKKTHQQQQSISSSKSGGPSIKPVSSTKRPLQVTALGPKPVDQKQKVTQQQPDGVNLGRLQSNRALARQKLLQDQQQQLYPRVITEHEIASEFTNTPYKAGTASHNASGIGLISGLKLTTGFKQANESAQVGVDVGETKLIRDSEENEEEESDDDEEEVDTVVAISQADTIIPDSITDHQRRQQNMEVEQPEEEDQEIQGGVSPLMISKESLKGDDRHQKKERKLSPLLERGERDLIWDNALGGSFDSKQVASALGFLDLKQICLCLAHALDRHIQFSQGFYFLDDLQEQIKVLHLEDHLKLDFSYEIDPKLKIGLDKGKPKEQSEQNRKQFEELKHSLVVVELPKKKVFDYNEVPLQKLASEEEGQFERDEDPSPSIEYGIEGEEDQAKAEDEQYIQDFYGNKSGNGTLEKEILKVREAMDKHQEEDEDEGLDLDYSFSHLEDFLKSHKKNLMTSGGAGGSSLITTQKINSQITSAEDGVSKIPPNSVSKNATTQQLMNTFLTSYSKNKGGNSAREGSKQQQETIMERRAEESGSSDGMKLIRLQEVDNLNDTLESERSSLVELGDTMKIDVRTKEGFKDLIRFQMRIFDSNYDFETDQLDDAPLADENPTLEELYYYCKYVIVSGRMEKEIPILCLVYIERFLTKTGILLNHLNWRRLTLISLCLASKIWDDDSLENVHFPKVMPDVTLREIAALEKVFLQFLDFDLLIRGAEYAKYYFILKTVANELDSGGMNSCLPPIGPLSAQKMADLQNNTAKVESELRDKYEVRLSLQKTM